MTLVLYQAFVIPALGLAGALERNSRARFEHDIEAPPRLVVDQLPAMTAARRVLGQQDLARLQDEVLAAARLEVELAAQGDHELADRRGMPFEGPAGPGLLERGLRGAELAREEIAARAGREIDDALLGMRILVLAGPKAHTPDLFLPPLHPRRHPPALTSVCCDAVTR